MTDDREPIEKVRDELKALSSVEICSPSSYTMELEGKVRALTARLAAAEAAARWCYRILVDNQDLSHFYATDQWPWLADEAAKGGRDE